MGTPFGKVDKLNIPTLKSKIDQMLQRHDGPVQLQVWTSDPDSLWSAMPYQKSFTLAADGSKKVEMSSANSMVKNVWSSDIHFSLFSANSGQELVASNLRQFAVSTPNRPRQAFDEAYCFVVFTETGVRIERKEFAPPYEGKRSSAQAFWSVLELTLLD